jgi:hypothetical protein
MKWDWLIVWCLWYVLTEQKPEEQKVEVQIVDSLASSEKKEAEDVRDSWDQEEEVKDAWDAESSEDGEKKLCWFCSHKAGV